MREELLKDPISQLLYGVGEVNLETWKRVFEDDASFLVFASLKRSELPEKVEHLYGLPVAIVEELFSYDLETWKGALKTGKAARFESLRKRFTSRLEVFRKNREVLEELTSIFSIDRQGYLDIGCGHGFTMLAARTLGYSNAHGVEVDPGFFKLGKRFFPGGIDEGIGYAADDFLSLEFGSRYSLITFFDVLEHVADYDVALRKALSLLNPSGLIYLYQGNRDSVQMTRLEPHYRVPMLTQLPRSLAIEILLRLRKISSESSYVVANWPALDLFSRTDSYVGLIKGPRNFRNGLDYMDEKHADNSLIALKKEYTEMYGPILSPGEMSVVDDAYSQYLQRYTESKADQERYNKMFLMSSWNLVMSEAEDPLTKYDQIELLPRAV